MKQIIAIMKQVITPLALLLFIVISIVGAVLSGCIEYRVLHAWLVDSNTSGSASEYIPIAIVFILEGSKIFLHLGHSMLEHFILSVQNALHRKGDAVRSKEEELQGAGEMEVSHNQKLLFGMKVFKWGLVLFSFFCTILFMTNSFYQEIPAAREELIAQQTESTEAEYGGKIAAAQKKADEEIERKVAPEKTRWEDARKEVAAVSPPIDGGWRENYNYEQAIAVLRENEAKAYEEYKAVLESAQAKAGEERDKDIAILEAEQAEALSRIEEDVMLGNVGDNMYLSNSLMFFSETFKSGEYSRTTYCIWVVLIALLISAAMEAAIYFGQVFIGLKENVLLEIFSSQPIGDSKFGIIIKTILYMLACAVLSFAFFLVFGLISELPMKKEILAAGFCCYLIALALSYFLKSFQERQAQRQQTESGSNRSGWLDQLREGARSMIIEATISFVFFVLLGLIFGESAASLSISSVGVTIGAAGGYILRLPISSLGKNAIA